VVVSVASLLAKKRSILPEFGCDATADWPCINNKNFDDWVKKSREGCEGDVAAEQDLA
jgi:hypothetical protein